ncbi:MAG: glycosyltransferase family 4 protein [Candidatus Saccharimonadales bacterium]
MKQLKVGIVLDDSIDRNDGVQQYVRTLGAWLESQNHIVHYLVGESKKAGSNVHSLSRNMGVTFNGNNLTMPLPANRSAIKKLLTRESFDVLHVQMPYSPFLAGRIIRAAGLDVAIVGTFHIMPLNKLHSWGSRILGIVQKRTLARFDAICSVSPAAAHFADQTFGVRSEIIPNMIKVSDWHTSTRIKRGKIVFLGRLVSRKGCKQLLLALAELPVRLRQQTDVYIAGDGPERPELEDLADKLNLTNVTFLGYIDEQDKPKLLASADLAIFPSLGGESFGIVLLEAMAAGSGIVLGGDNPGYRSVLGTWPNTLVQPDYPREVARTIKYFLTNTSWRKTTHKEQQKMIKQYDVNTVGPEIVQLYKDALHKRA